MSRTVDKIVAASNLPLSIVIVGVGSADFANMVSANIMQQTPKWVTHVHMVLSKLEVRWQVPCLYLKLMS